MSKKWEIIVCKTKDLQLKPTLLGGQCFRWRYEDNHFIGVVGNSVWKMRHEENCIYHQRYHSSDETGEDSDIIRKYLRLDVDLDALYDDWSNRDPYFKEAAKIFYGIRMLKQDVVENVFSFICSSNNNISRISSMVEKLCELYGTPIAEVDGKRYFSFPPVRRLAEETVENQLREAGFGYRAKFIHQTACKIIQEDEVKWLDKLQKMPYEQAKRTLMNLPGVGAKVADCICLMSLNHLEAIPVDTHIFQIASTRYLPHLKQKKSMTDKVYNEIGDFFRKLFGKYAGWAHTEKVTFLLKESKRAGAITQEGEKISKKLMCYCTGSAAAPNLIHLRCLIKLESLFSFSMVLFCADLKQLSSNEKPKKRKFDSTT